MTHPNAYDDVCKPATASLAETLAIAKMKLAPYLSKSSVRVFVMGADRSPRRLFPPPAGPRRRGERLRPSKGPQPGAAAAAEGSKSMDSMPDADAAAALDAAGAVAGRL